MDKEQIIADLLNAIDDYGQEAHFGLPQEIAEKLLEQSGWVRDSITGAWIKP